MTRPDHLGRTVLDRLEADLRRADRLNHTVAVVEREDLRALLAAIAAKETAHA